MFNLTDTELQEFTKEDVPYLDLTTYSQNIINTNAKLEIFAREDIVASCSEEAARIAKIFGCEVEYSIPSSTHIKTGEKILSFKGDYNHVHQAWRSSQLILEYSCAIATYAYKMKKEIEEVNPYCELLTTRKHFPFAKRFCIKSIIAGSAMPHRLGLSETILLFPHHRIVYGSDMEFYKNIQKIKLKNPEKKIVVESDNFEDAKNILENNADVLQLDKVSLDEIYKIISYKNKNFPHVKILLAGNININNVKDFAQTGADGVVTSAVYFCPMANLGSKIEILE